jgi:hypothetical protein
MFLFDMVPTRGCGAGLVGSTIANYCSQVTKHWSLVYGESVPRTQLAALIIKQLKAIPGPSRHKDCVDPLVVRDVLLDERVSLASRMCLAMTWYCTLRLGQSTSKVVETYNATTALLRRDVTFDSDEVGTVTLIRIAYHTSKSDTFNEGVVRFLRPLGPGFVCPVHLLLRFWKETSHMEADKPFLRHVGDGRLVTSAHVVKALKRAAERRGYDPRHIGGHSPRISGANELVSHDVPALTVAEHCGWASEKSALRYMRMNSVKFGQIMSALALPRTDTKLKDETRMTIMSSRVRF